MTHNEPNQLEHRVEDLLGHYEKHLADTRREHSAHEFARYAIEYCARVPLKRPTYPPQPHNSPGMMIYQQREKKNRVGWH